MTTGGCGSEWCAVRITEGGRLVQTRWGEERTVSPKPVDDADEVIVKVDSWSSRSGGKPEILTMRAL